MRLEGTHGHSPPNSLEPRDPEQSPFPGHGVVGLLQSARKEKARVTLQEGGGWQGQVLLPLVEGHTVCAQVTVQDAAPERLVRTPTCRSGSADPSPLFLSTCLPLISTIPFSG